MPQGKNLAIDGDLAVMRAFVVQHSVGIWPFLGAIHSTVGGADSDFGVMARAGMGGGRGGKQDGGGKRGEWE